MYSYTWDPETGGLLLNSTPLSFSKEPRPVYYKELDILGFDQYWNYEKNDAFPYMWAEANNYIYRGRTVARTKGGSLYTAPELVLLEDPEPEGQPLRFVDIPAMVEKNQDLLEKLADDTIKKIYNTFMEYQNRVDVFYVAFSGGKDSIVTLDLVQRALPHNEFMVLFGDTGMEFSDTYDTVDQIEEKCKDGNIRFLRSKSDRAPCDTWNQFGPPATVTRWCCSVHKTAPQILTLREMTGKIDFTGMAFIGVRASESLSRSDYDYVSLGEKHKGQYSVNPILEWNSAELYLYIYAEALVINEAYKKGNRRVGCLVCPRAAERNDFMARAWYGEEFDELIEIIRQQYRGKFSSSAKLDEFIANGGWKARKNGRDISLKLNYTEVNRGNYLGIHITNPTTDWKTWIRTIGILLNDSSPYRILYRNKQYTFDVLENGNSVEVRYSPELPKENPTFIKLLKNVFRKAACCVGCRECEADCHNGCISMKNGKLSISDRCIHCTQCHKVEKGCLIYKSLEMPKGGSNMAEKSLNCYSHHAPKMEWFVQYIQYKNEFKEKCDLGSQMLNFFRRFLRDAEMLDDNGYTEFATVVEKLGLDDVRSWGLMLANLAYTPQINWLIKRIDINETVGKDYTMMMLVNDGADEKWVKDVWSSFSRILDLPFSEVGLGVTERDSRRRLLSITRTGWDDPDPAVVLYSLYKFAEAKAEDDDDNSAYHQFTLSRLLDHEADSARISPTEIFGLDRRTMEKLLNGMNTNYPDFINTSFTLDLDNITLNNEKTAQDVLKLF